MGSTPPFEPTQVESHFEDGLCQQSVDQLAHRNGSRPSVRFQQGVSFDVQSMAAPGAVPFAIDMVRATMKRPNWGSFDDLPQERNRPPRNTRCRVGGKTF